MAASNYDESLRRLLRHEGGYSNHPSDPGGPTNFGITIHDYRKYVKAAATAADVRAMTLDQAKAIYRAKYWAAMRCDELPAGLDYAVFDYAVNSGTGRAPKVLQRLLGFPDDGRLGDALLAAIRKRDATDLIARLCDERLAFLKRLKTWPVFGKGWSRRVAEVRASALAMALASQPAATMVQPAPGKGQVPAPVAAQRSTAGAAALAGIAAAHEASASGVRPAFVALILVAAAAVALGGWLAWRKRRQIRQER
jgi:lysozyme family protein